MKKILILIVVILFATAGYAQYPDIGWEGSTARLILAEHTPVVIDSIFLWGGDSTGHIEGADTIWTPWFMVGHVDALDADPTNRPITRHCPRYAELIGRWYNLGSDSILIKKVWWQATDDTTLVPLITLDDAHIFIQDGNGDSNFMYEDVRSSADSLGYLIPIGSFYGGDYLRLFMEGDTNADSTDASKCKLRLHY